MSTAKRVVKYASTGLVNLGTTFRNILRPIGNIPSSTAKQIAKTGQEAPKVVGKIAKSGLLLGGAAA